MASFVPAERDLRRVIGDGERSPTARSKGSASRICSTSTGRWCCCAPTTSARSSTTARAASARTRSSGTTRRCRPASCTRSRTTTGSSRATASRRSGSCAGCRRRRSSPGGAATRPAGGTRPTTTSPRSASRSRRRCRTRPGSPGGSGCEARARARSTFFGDGATSEGAFHEGANFAAVMRRAARPPLQQQPVGDLDAARPRRRVPRRSPTRLSGYGIPGMRVDGGDVLAVYEATREAVARARAGDGPTFIEAVTYRAAPHATADDPKAYIDLERVEEERANECVGRYEGYLRRLGLLDDELEREIKAEARRRRCARASPRPRPSRRPTSGSSSSTRSPTRRVVRPRSRRAAEDPR